MLNPAIYRTIFNLDKDRKDLPAGNRAVPYQTASTGGDDLPPAPDIKPYMPIPKPPATRSKEQSPEAAPVELTAEETIDITNEPEASYGTSTGVTGDALPDGLVDGGPKPKGMMKDAERRATRQTVQQKTTADGQVQEEGYYKPSVGVATSKDQRSAAERNAFFDESESTPGGIPPQLDRAAREAQIQEQARAALGGPQAERSIASSVAEAPEELRPGTPKQLRRADEDIKYNEKLKAALPFKDPQNANEKAQNRKAELQFKAQNPRNEDHGIKGFIKETLQNFFFGLSKAQGVPGISMGQALMLGGAGAGAGMLNRGWNEQRMAEGQLAGATQDVEFEAGQEKTRRTLDAQDASVGIRQQDVDRKAANDVRMADYKTRSLGIQEKYRQEYLDLLQTRDVYKNANDKVKANQAQQRINLLEKNYRLNEAKAGAKGITPAGGAPAVRTTPITPEETKLFAAGLQKAYDQAVADGNAEGAARLKEEIQKVLSGKRKVK